MKSSHGYEIKSQHKNYPNVNGFTAQLSNKNYPSWNMSYNNNFIIKSTELNTHSPITQLDFFSFRWSVIPVNNQNNLIKNFPSYSQTFLD